MKTCTLIYNPIAGRHPARREKEIRRASIVLENSGLKVQVKPTTGPGVAQDLAREAVRGRSDMVLVCGGDGTINEVINGLATSPVPLGILPGGTANILGKELRLPHNPVRAAAELARWTPRRIALGKATWNTGTQAPPGFSPAPVDLENKVNKAQAPCYRYFVSVAGIGFDAHIVYKLSGKMKMSLGVAGYVLEALRQWARYPFPTFTSKLDGRDTLATFAVIHRTRLYAGWLHLAPTASLFEPRFAACSFLSRSRARYLLYAAAVLLRTHLRLGDVKLAEARKVCCLPADPSDVLRFELDGELVGTLPATFEIVPDALTLLVPPGEIYG